ncbi:MAG TPA: hypothetical protein VHT49_00255 [Acidimicrobiales bacterium]|jgi:hypothetical protein|nr:hypothetical protein [Acidimicrobiales bacterium]
MATTIRQGQFPATGADVAASDHVSSRQAALTDAIARIRVRTQAIKLDQVLLILGGVAMPAGILVIIIGWYGAAHTFRTYAQLDYLISGGLLGLALVVFGGFCYFGYFLTRMVQLFHTNQTQDRQTLETLERISAQLAQLAPAGALSASSVAAPAAVAAPAPSGATPVASRAFAPVLVATRHGSMAHLPTCPVVADNPDLRPANLEDPNLTPCQICQPFAR